MIGVPQSCYIQHREASGETDLSPSIEDPYLMGENYLSRLRGMDNGNTIIIFDDSHSGSIEDTIISARQKYEVSYSYRLLESYVFIRLTLTSRADGDVYHFI